MTPEYASPEQVRGQAVTTGSDIYGLGALAYTLISGRKPHVLHSSAPGEIERVVCLEEPRPLGELTREARGDLEAIVGKAMRKEPGERYLSVERLSEDLRRYLDGAPVEARRNLFRYRAGKFIRRNRLLVTAAVAVVLALTVGAGLAIWQARRAERRFQQVRGLAHAFLFDIDSTLGNVPGTLPARQTIVRTTLSYIENLAQEARGDSDLQLELAAGYQRIAEIQGSPSAPNIGDTQGSVESYRKAQDLRRAAGARESHDPAVRRAYLFGQIEFAYALERAGRLADVQSIVEEVARDADRWVAGQPSEIRALEIAQQSHQALANTYQRLDIRRSIEERKRALELSRTVAGIRRNDAASQQTIASALMGIGMAFDRINDRAEGARYHLEALNVYRGLAARDPSDPKARRYVMITASLAGSSLRVAGQLDQAAQLNQESLAIAESNLKADPVNGTALMDALAVNQRTGDVLSDMQKWDEAGRLYQRALELSERLVQLDPGNREARLNYGLAMVRVGALDHQKHRLKEAVAWRRKAEAIYGVLAAEAPGDRKIANPRMHNFMVMGEWLDDAGDPAAARDAYRQAEAIGRKVVTADPLEKEAAAGWRPFGSASPSGHRSGHLSGHQ